MCNTFQEISSLFVWLASIVPCVDLGTADIEACLMIPYELTIETLEIACGLKIRRKDCHKADAFDLIGIAEQQLRNGKNCLAL